MEDVKQQLQEAFTVLKDAGNNKRYLGFALQTFHGILETHLRYTLSQFAGTPDTNSFEDVQWNDLADLAVRHLGVSYDERAFLLSMNSIRNKVAHNKPFTITRTQVEQYAHLVQKITGNSHTTFTTPQPHVVTVTNPINQPYEQRYAERPVTQMSGSSGSYPKKNRLGCYLILLIITGLCLGELMFPSLMGRIFFDDREMSLRKVFALIFDNPSQEGESAVIRVQVKRTSSVRQDPDDNSPIVGYVNYGEVYEVLETNPNGNWYKILLGTGTEGWIGYNRVTVLSQVPSDTDE